MAKCEIGGNDYDKAFEVIATGKSRTFGSFVCTIRTVCGAHLSALRVPNSWSWASKTRKYLLCCPLRFRVQRPGSSRLIAR
jgi:hypothetical protein